MVNLFIAMGQKSLQWFRKENLHRTVEKFGEQTSLVNDAKNYAVQVVVHYPNHRNESQNPT